MPKLNEVFVIPEASPNVVNPKVEKVMNGSDIAQFGQADFLALALACLDQADIPLPIQNKIEKLCKDNIRLPAEGPDDPNT
jgi:hypothetical protein